MGEGKQEVSYGWTKGPWKELETDLPQGDLHHQEGMDQGPRIQVVNTLMDVVQ